MHLCMLCRRSNAAAISERLRDDGEARPAVLIRMRILGAFSLVTAGRSKADLGSRAERGGKKESPLLGFRRRSVVSLLHDSLFTLSRHLSSVGRAIAS